MFKLVLVGAAMAACLAGQAEAQLTVSFTGVSNFGAKDAIYVDNVQTITNYFSLTDTVAGSFTFDLSKLPPLMTGGSSFSPYYVYANATSPFLSSSFTSSGLTPTPMGNGTVDSNLYFDGFASNGTIVLIDYAYNHDVVVYDGLLTYIHADNAYNYLSFSNVNYNRSDLNGSPFPDFNSLSGGSAFFNSSRVYGDYIVDRTTGETVITGTYRVWQSIGEPLTLTVSNGAVPEPATWAMMIAGFGMIGAAMRTRRRSTKVSFA